MKINVGRTDSIIRIVLGLIIIAFGLFLQTWLGAIGFVLILTAFAGYCPIYSVFGLSTRNTGTVNK